MKRTLTPLQAKAEEALSYFEHKQRPGDPEKTFWSMKDSRPEWIKDMVYQVHDNGAILPDDYKFAFVVASLDRIMDYDDPDEASDEIEADVYTSDLYDWLSSNLNRAAYVDEAVKDFGGEPGGIVDQIMLGQAAEKREVYWTVLNFLLEQMQTKEEV